MLDVTPLLPLCSPHVEEKIMASWPLQNRPDKLLAGYLGLISFVVTLDGGDCEASICIPSGRPTSAHVAAFFRKWGQPIPDDPPVRISGGKGLHWVISRATRN